MKKYILTILSLSLISHFGLAQIAINDLKQLKNVPQYKDGEQALNKHFLRSTKVSREMMSNPEVCTVLGVIKVKKSGTIEEIGTLNKVPKPFKNQFIEVAKLTDGKWMPSNETSEFSYFIIPIQFSVNGAEYNVDISNIPKYFHEPIVVVGYLPSNSFLNYKEDSKYLNKVDDFVAKGKNDRAIETMEYLLSRQPFNTDYYRKIIELNEKAGKKDEVEYYTSLIEVLSDKN